MAEGKSEEDKAVYVRPFSEILTTAEGKKPLAEDVERRRRVIGLVVKEVNGLGTGSEKGASIVHHSLLLVFTTFLHRDRGIL